MAGGPGVYSSKDSPMWSTLDANAVFLMSLIILLAASSPWITKTRWVNEQTAKDETHLGIRVVSSRDGAKRVRRITNRKDVGIRRRLGLGLLALGLFD